MSKVREKSEAYSAATFQLPLPEGEGRGEGIITSHLPLLSAAPNGIQKLRGLILELAGRGKLVPQDPNDEPASLLLRKVTSEKERLVKQGAFSKQQRSPCISNTEIPHSIPPSWEWVRLNDVGFTGTGKTPSTSNTALYGGELPFVGPGQITMEGKITMPDKWISQQGRSHTTIANPGDVLMVCIGGSIGKTAIADKEIAFNQQINCLHPVLVDYHYAGIAMSSPRFQDAVRNAATGSATPIINRSKWDELLIPLPPLAEQHRIVAKVDELMALCDRLEAQQADAGAAHERLVKILLDTLTQSQDAADFAANWQRLSAHFDTLFTTEASIDALKQTLLQLAVMGKLVPQDPNDEPTHALLQRIDIKKARLAKKGKMKKEKQRQDTSGEDAQFAVPPTWSWIRLGDALPEFQNGESSRGDAGGSPTVVIRLADIKGGKVSLEGTRKIPIRQESTHKYGLSAGDILIVRVNGSADIVGRFIVCDQDLEAIYCDHFIRMRIRPQWLSPAFLGLLGSSALIRDQIKSLFITTAGQKTVNQGHISSLVMPLPPLAEQHRIIAKLDELMALCDTLKARLAESRALHEHLATTLVEQAVAA